MAGSGTAHLRPEGDALLRAEHLTVEFPVGRTGLKVHAVSDVSLDILPGETLGLVGESGCGKSTTGRALIQFPPPKQGRVAFDGVELTELDGEDMRRMRTRMQMIFQDPISSLNPRRRVGDIVAEPLAIWAKPRNETRALTTTIAAIVSLVTGAAIALMGAGLVVFAPIAVVASIETPVILLSSGPIAIVAVIFGGLMLALGLWILRLGRGLWNRGDDAWNGSLITYGYLAGLIFFVGGLVGGLGGFLAVLPVVLLFILPIVLLLLPPSREDFPKLGPAEEKQVDDVLEVVGLDPEAAKGRRRHEFSGGQCQRISVARALILDPKLLVCDEPVSALDVSVQAQVLNLLEELKAKYDLTMVFIAHDLAVVKNISDRVAVMYLGKLCEVASPDDLYSNPAHPYTRALLEAVPVPDPSVSTERPPVRGEPASPVLPPSGCRFRTRCPRAEQRCAEVEPWMREVAPGQFVACHFPYVGEQAPSEDDRAEQEKAPATA